MTPEECAKQVIEKFNIVDVPAKCFGELFEKNKIIYHEKNFTENSFSGCLIKKQGKVAILVNTSTNYKQRENFTKAHELGHFFLNHKGDKFECTANDIKTNDSVHRPFEVEANQFASSFLMPQERVELLLCDENFDITTISEIANTYLVSLSSATLRLIPMLSGKWCAIHSKSGIVDWTVKSPTFKYASIKAGDKLDEDSIAYECFRQNRNVSKDCYTFVPSGSWIKGNIKAKTMEQSFFMVKRNEVLSLIKTI